MINIIFAAIFDHKNFTDSGIKGNKTLVLHVTTCIIISFGLPLTLVTICALYSLVRKDHVAPIYVINLLITDFFQLCCMIDFESIPEAKETLTSFVEIMAYTYHCFLLASVGFMVCVSLERYLVIAHPLWYRFRRNIKITVAVCAVVWMIPPILYIIMYFLISGIASLAIPSLLFAIPFPLFIFFLVGTLRALSTSVSVSSREKQRIVGIQVLVLLIYMFLFLPSIIHYLKGGVRLDKSFSSLTFMFAKLNPLADVALYIFIRKDTVGKSLTSSCCCKMESNGNRVPADEI